MTIGPRVYINNGNANSVECFDFSKNASCANFPHATAGADFTYTVNADPQRPSCIWVNADGGISQIQNFDAYSGGPCGAGSLRVLSSAIVVPLVECQPANFTSLTVESPSPSTYGGGTVQFLDNDGLPIAGIPQEALAAGAIDLTPFNLTTKTALPQFLITLNHPGNVSSVTVKLVWTGANAPACVANGVSVSGSNGMMMLGRDGGLFAYGGSAFEGSATGLSTSAFTGIASVNDRDGYLVVAADGEMFPIGKAATHGDLSKYVLAGRIMGIATTPSGNGYWMVGADGGAFAFGDAHFYGSMAGRHLAAPVVAIIATPTGHGYMLIAADGGTFAFGDAHFYGSMAGHQLAAPIVSAAMTPTGNGYYLAGGDGGAFAFGRAIYRGGVAGVRLTAPVSAIVLTQDGLGYWLVGGDAGVFTFGDAPFLIGRTAAEGGIPYLGQSLQGPIVAAAG